MTKEEKLEILGAKLVEVYEAIRDTGAKDDKLPGLFHFACEMEWHMECLERPEEHDPFTVPAPVAPKQDLDPAPAPETKQTPPPDPTEPGMTKAEMVSKLTAFQTNGVAIDKVMESMGYTKLSQVPADRYWELLELCQKALDGEG